MLDFKDTEKITPKIVNFDGFYFVALTNQSDKVITAGAFVNKSDLSTALGMFKALAINDEPSDMTIQDIFKVVLSDNDKKIINFKEEVLRRNFK